MAISMLLVGNMAANKERSEALETAVADRMDELGLSPRAFAEQTGVTEQGLAPLRRGEVKNYQKRLTLPVTKLFGWTPDSIERLMRGEPAKMAMTPVRPESAVELLAGFGDATAAVAQRFEDARREIADLEHRLAVVEERLRECAQSSPQVAR